MPKTKTSAAGPSSSKQSKKSAGPPAAKSLQSKKNSKAVVEDENNNVNGKKMAKGKQQLDPKSHKKDDKSKKAKSKSPVSFSYYLYIVMREIHPEMSISTRAMGIMNNLVTDVFERLAAEAAQLAKVHGQRTLHARDFEAACKLLLPGELAKHAVSEGSKALNKYLRSIGMDKITKAREMEEQGEAEKRLTKKKQQPAPKGRAPQPEEEDEENDEEEEESHEEEEEEESHEEE